MPTLRDRLEALRNKLLDLSFRNRLLNHSDTGRRILKVRRLSLADLYTVLVDGGKTLTISAAPVETPAPLTATGDSVKPALGLRLGTARLRIAGRSGRN